MSRAALVLSLLLTLTGTARAEFHTLLTAARTGDTATVLQLLASGEAPDPPDHHHGYSPLQFAAGRNDAEAVRALLAAGADTEYRDHNGDRALLWAARGLNAESLRLLLEAGSPPDSDDDRYGRTALMDAAFVGQAKSVRLLLDHGADIHRFDQSGDTALHYAARGGSSDVARMLLDGGAHPGVVGEHLFRTPLHTAATWGDPELIALLLKEGPRDSRDVDGLTPLMTAALSGRTKNVEALLAAGARTEIAADDGMTPLLVAVRDGWVEMARLLLDAGANPAAIDKSGQGVEHYLEWHPLPRYIPEGSRMSSLGTEPDPEETARLDVAHSEIRAMLADR